MTEFKTAHKEFIDNLRELGRSESTLIAYGKDIEQLVEYLAKQGVNTTNEVKLEHLESFMARFNEQGYTAKSISRKTNSTKTFFKFLKDQGYIQEDASELLKHPKVEAKAPRILSRMEYRALRDAARDDVRTSALVEVLIQTGITISEVAGIELEHLHLDEAKPYLYIPARDSKDERTVPLNEDAVAAIRGYIDNSREDKESIYLFITKTGNPLLVRNIRSTVDRYFRIAGVEDVKVNDIRHTFAAHQLMKGVGLEYLSKVLGHKRVSTTEKYLEYIDREVEEGTKELEVL